MCIIMFPFHFYYVIYCCLLRVFIMYFYFIFTCYYGCLFLFILFYFYFILYCINLKSLSPTCTYTYPLAWTSLPIKMTYLFLFLYPMNPCNVPSLQPTCLAALLSALPLPSPSHPSTCTHVFSMTYTCPTCFTFPNPAMHHVWSYVLQKAIPPLAFFLFDTYIAVGQSRLSLHARTHPLIRRDHKYTRPTRREGRGPYK